MGLHYAGLTYGKSTVPVAPEEKKKQLFRWSWRFWPHLAQCSRAGMGRWPPLLHCELGVWLQWGSSRGTAPPPTLEEALTGWSRFGVWDANRVPSCGCFQDQFRFHSKLTACPDIIASPPSKLKLHQTSLVISVVDNPCLLYTQALSRPAGFAAREAPLHCTEHQMCDREPAHEERRKGKLGRCGDFLGTKGSFYQAS